MKKKNDTRWLFCLILTMWLVWPAKSMAQVDDCYAPAYQQGLALMDQGDYEKAIQYFRAALSCPTAPEGNDAQAKIDECKQLLAASSDPLSGFSVTGLQFAGAAIDGTIVRPYGEVLHADDFTVLCVRMTYDNREPSLNELKVDVKLYSPSGQLMGGTSGYTISSSVSVPSSGHSADLAPYVPSAPGTFVPGTYRCEVWSMDRCLSKATFSVEPRSVAVVPVADEPSEPAISTPSAPSSVIVPVRRPFEMCAGLSGGLATGVVTCPQAGLSVGLGSNVTPRLYAGAYAELSVTPSALHGGKPYVNAGVAGRYYFSPSSDTFYAGLQGGWSSGESVRTTFEHPQWRNASGFTQTNAVLVHGLSLGASVGYRFDTRFFPVSAGLHGSLVPCIVRTVLSDPVSSVETKAPTLLLLSLTLTVYL